MSYFIINTPVANIYKEPLHQSEVVTQGLLGESCEILDKKDVWYHIKQWDNYEGWVYYFHGIVSEIKYEYNLVSQDLFGEIIDGNGDTIRNITYGNMLNAVAENNGYKIILPDGQKGFSKNNFTSEINRATREIIIKISRKFIGVPYLWGGKSSYGMDCSGLVQTVFKSVGIELPRDANQQAEFFKKNKINVDKLQKSDLLFFAEKDNIIHVAISTGDQNFINAHGLVQEESIDNKNTLFNSKLRDLFLYGTSIKELLK